MILFSIDLIRPCSVPGKVTWSNDHQLNLDFKTQSMEFVPICTCNTSIERTTEAGAKAAAEPTRAATRIERTMVMGV
jgi:hypothetical protein